MKSILFRILSNYIQFIFTIIYLLNEQVTQLLIVEYTHRLKLF